MKASLTIGMGRLKNEKKILTIEMFHLGMSYRLIMIIKKKQVYFRSAIGFFWTALILKIRKILEKLLKHLIFSVNFIVKNLGIRLFHKEWKRLNKQNN